MLQSASTDTKKANARGNSTQESPQAVLQAPPVTAWGNQASLRLQRKCDCGGGPECDCDMSEEKKKRHQSPRTGLHRKVSESGATSAAPASDTGHAYPELRIGAVDDPQEHEADQVAERVLNYGGLSAPRTQQPAPKLRRKETGASSLQGGGVAPPAVHEVLSSGGGPLDPSTRAFFEARFGQDFSQVRIHTGQQAAASARSVGARAFTVGNNIVFGSGEYSPGNSSGQRLVAHELAHVVQQQQTSLPPLRRTCKAAGACAAPIPGDPGRFGEKTELEAENERKKSGPPAAGGGSSACANPRHKDEATKLAALVASEGVTQPPEVHGIFIEACMAPSAGGTNDLCSAFPPGVVAGPPSPGVKSPDTAPAGLNCVQVHAADEDAAAAIPPKPGRSTAQQQQAVDLASAMTHEFQHAHFNADPAKIVPAAPDCDVNTIVFHGPSPAPAGTDYPVAHYLSEMSAEISEFGPYFQNTKSSPGTASNTAMFDEERKIALNVDESISGIIQALQCKCECSTVDRFTAQVFNEATGAWPADQKDEFQKAMTRIMPSFWPVPLQKK
jgi:Domain of unknown function (DUF4157)